MTDADVALDQALRTVFPRAGDAAPELRLSEWHIQRMIRAKLPVVVLDDRTQPVGQAFPPALLNPVYWQRFDEAVRATAAAGAHGPLITAINFLDSYGPPGAPTRCGATTPAVQSKEHLPTGARRPPSRAWSGCRPRRAQRQRHGRR